MPKPGLLVHSDSPYNAESPLGRLIASAITPHADLYVRSHGTIPRLDDAAHRVHVDGRVAKPLSLSVADLRGQFQPRTVIAVLQCAGNRRADMRQVRPVLGDPWAPGAIGNVEWTGVALRDVLQEAGANPDAGHVAFASADEIAMPDEGTFHFGVSIPMAKALHPDTILAYAMNGEPLAPEHGRPVRIVTPGYAGVRSPKWLAGITVQDEPSDNHMQQRDYKLLPPHVDAGTVDWSQGIAINDMPLNAAICTPQPGAKLGAGPADICGYAVATERGIARVDVSGDGGRTWTQAALDHDQAAPWSWTRWHAVIDLPRGAHDLVVRAWDSAGQTQPSAPDDTWNFKGYLSASWHRVRVTVE